MDHFSTGTEAGDGVGRKRTRTDSIADDAVFHLQFATKSLKHVAMQDEEIHYKTCFYVGEWKVKSTSEVKAIWVTALHGGLGMDMTVQIHKSVTHVYMGQVIHVNETSDVAIVAATYVPDCEPLLIHSSRHAMEKVVIAGFGTSMHANDTACLVGCNISNVDAGNNISQLKPEFGDDFARWRTSRFFLLDKTTDFGFSGAPVVDCSARVVGMLCASEYVSVSWALKSDFIKDALEECVTNRT